MDRQVSTVLRMDTMLVPAFTSACPRPHAHAPSQPLNDAARMQKPGTGLYSFMGISDRNSLRKSLLRRKAPRMMELIMRLFMSLTPRQAMQ